jgi:transcriptional regulator with GAF, ATPase, and Fis domain
MAANVDLRVALRQGRLREYHYRLSVVPIEIPPLRERRMERSSFPGAHYRAP